MTVDNNKKSKSSQLKVRTHLRAGFTVDQLRNNLQPLITEAGDKAQTVLGDAQNSVLEGSI